MAVIKNTKPKDLDKNKLRYIFRRIIERIKEKEKGFFQIKKLKGYRGLWYYGDMIEIDYRKEVIPTIIHEVLHDLYENNTEKWVYQVESKISQILKTKDIINLLQAFISNLK
jgi:hypothetical protein